MITTVTLNSIMQWVYMVTVLFCIGDIDAVTNTPTRMPIIEVYYEATKSTHATNLLVVMMALILFISLFNILASVSRLTWAFARDNGLPFSNVFSYVSSCSPSLPTPIFHPDTNLRPNRSTQGSRSPPTPLASWGSSAASKH
jgi:amino acid transporter